MGEAWDFLAKYCFAPGLGCPGVVEIWSESIEILGWLRDDALAVAAFKGEGELDTRRLVSTLAPKRPPQVARA